MVLEHRSLFELDGKANPEFEALTRDRKVRLLDWKDFFADRKTFVKDCRGKKSFEF